MALDDNYPKFEEWLLRVIKVEKPKEDIIGYNIGFFQTRVTYSVYLMGARQFSADDGDWACKPCYYPADKYYDFPKDFAKDKEPEDIEKLVVSFAKKFAKTAAFKNSFLGRAQGVTAGWDEGELHLIS